MDFPSIIRRRLDTAIQYVDDKKEHFVTNPGKDFSRNRKLGMGDAIGLLISMSGGTLQRELYRYAAAGGVDISPSAFCQSRAKISPKAFETVFRRFNMMCNDKKTYRRYNLYAIDGSCINMARNPDSPCFVQNESNPRGYCQFHLNAWYDLENKTYFDAILQPQPRADERAAALSMIERNSFRGRSNILTLDRGYESYALIATILEKPNLDFVCRVRQDKGCMKAIQGWPMERIDKDVTVTLTTSQSREHKERGYIFIQTHKHKDRKYSAKTESTAQRQGMSSGHGPVPTR